MAKEKALRLGSSLTLAAPQQEWGELISPKLRTHTLKIIRVALSGTRGPGNRVERCLGILEPHLGKSEGLAFGIRLLGDRDTGD